MEICVRGANYCCGRVQSSCRPRWCASDGTVGSEQQTESSTGAHAHLRARAAYSTVKAEHSPLFFEISARTLLHCPEVLHERSFERVFVAHKFAGGFYTGVHQSTCHATSHVQGPTGRRGQGRHRAARIGSRGRHRRVPRRRLLADSGPRRAPAEEISGRRRTLLPRLLSLQCAPT